MPELESTGHRRLHEDTYDSEPEPTYDVLQEFYLLFAVLQGVGFTTIILVAVWTDKYLGGFAWDGSGKMFNWHPVLMIIGFVYLYGNAAVIYRVMRTKPKFKVKLVHAGLHTCALFAAVIGLVAVFGFHEHNNIPNLYSIHSWVGFATVILFTCQLLLGFCGFLYPKFSEEGRKRYLNIHVYFGGVIFVLALIACISGINEKMVFAFSTTYSQFNTAGMMGNSLGVCLIIFAMLVGYILNKSSR